MPHPEVISFRTDDLALAALLHVEGFRFSVEAVGPKAFFIFESSDDLEEIVGGYHDGLVEVQPRRYAQAMGHCRNKMADALGWKRRNGK